MTVTEVNQFVLDTSYGSYAVVTATLLLSSPSAHKTTLSEPVLLGIPQHNWSCIKIGQPSKMQ